MAEGIGRPVCVFLVPLVRDSDRKPHPPILWRVLQDALVRLFEGLGGPETALYYRTPDAVPGSWSPGQGEETVEDLSRKYTVALAEERVDGLRALPSAGSTPAIQGAEPRSPAPLSKGRARALPSATGVNPMASPLRDRSPRGSLLNSYSR